MGLQLDTYRMLTAEKWLFSDISIFNLFDWHYAGTLYSICEKDHR